MKHFLLVIDAQEGFMVDGITDPEIARIHALLESDCFDCVISSIYQNVPDSNIIRFMGWAQLLTAQEQKLVDVVATNSHHRIYKQTYSAYSETLAELLMRENGGSLPECVFVVGFDLECCVLMTAAELFEHGIRPIVLTAYCGASGGEEARLAGTRTLYSLIGSNNISPALIHTPDDLDQIYCSAAHADHPAAIPTQARAQHIVDHLYELGWRISFAESCTGGKAADGLMGIPGASSVFEASFVTCTDKAKTELVGVSPDTIHQFGVVSEPVAAEMAAGAASRTNAQVGVSITGIIDPADSTADKPLGMVCFGFYVNGQMVTRTVQFGAVGRNAIRQVSVDFAYDTLLEILYDCSEQL